MTRRHSRDDPREDVGEDVGVGVVECDNDTDFLTRIREKMGCVGRKTVAVLGESVSVSMSASYWNASFTSHSRDERRYRNTK